jgi:transglutaminase-like putative cysteine protease
MRLKLRHQTHYAYDSPARGVIQILRLTPRNHETQFVRRWRVEIDADCRLDRDEDAFGNITHTFSLESRVESMTILVEGEVDVAEDSGIIRGTYERFPLPFWRSGTALTQWNSAIEAYAQDQLAQEGGDTIAFLHRLCGSIHQDFAFKIGETEVSTTALEAFAARSGVCQDYAHVFIAAARSQGIPARYIGGYFLRSDTVEQEAGHAWAEAYVPALGWVGFDPAHGCSTDSRYIRVATGRDYLEAAPVRGARLGGVGETMQVAVHLSPGREIIGQ